MAYFPNGSEGATLDIQCSDCLHSDIDILCPVAQVQMEFNYEQCDDGNGDLRKAMTILINDKGVCQVKKAIEKSKRTVVAKNPCLQKKLVFGDEEQINALKTEA